ncbi:GFA family protein [Pararhizobium qamdonense]|jgi:hypothetical protein|uniref:GFA family protein n=1 Tax=Pararhizobium qamdonense TaxID=3031126 RepID=UPI0023E255FA|nr:GFA family protein [Pararhizobium qamdonense]
MKRPYRLSCHCGDICFEIDEEISEVVECNCSTCRRSGFLHWKVPASTITLVSEKRRISTYVWRSITEGHHFCATCGVALMRSGYPGEKVSVNARCIEGIDIFELTIERYDGRTDMHPGPLP